MSWESDNHGDIGEMDEEDYRSHAGQINLSRLSVCTSNTSVFAEEEEDINMNMMSVLSLESFDADVEEDDFNLPHVVGQPGKGLTSSDDGESSGCYSLPATPPRQRRAKQQPRHHRPHTAAAAAAAAAKECVSETEAADSQLAQKRRRRRLRRRSIMRKRLLADSVFWKKFQDDDDDNEDDDLMFDRRYAATVITKPKGGERSLQLDLEEVKACSELGFDLDLPFPPIITTTRSNTSSASNSPVGAASWRISSPGDDPRDIKARLKVWAQAVALASASASPYRHPTA